ncbi:RCC1 domain-containing protein 1 [Zerene cesonia]|uniref:RCC1 domain-containing protein 1 n=1 Tax=Zerene cesonia TaxID=33412 RepID=UPI0018E52C38|nr:RCC1 domain-containing protein 1 [Zerene cesonia]
MYKVAGSNLFGQWLHKDCVFDHFRLIINNNIDSNSSLACISWSYNLFQIKKDIYISGAFRGKEEQFVKLNLPEQLQDGHILITGNDYHLVIVNSVSNIMYILDLGTDQYKEVKFVESVNKDEISVVKVVATNTSCIYLTSAGDIYSGMLPILFDTCLDGKVLDVVLGYEHYVLLTESGKIFTWGNGRRLQLGHGDLNNLDQPTEVKALAGIKIVKISAGGWHTCALSEFGDLYVWGWNDTGQLGVKERQNEDYSSSDFQSYGLPILVDIYDDSGRELDINIKDVACGSRHTAILLEDGSIWTSGCNKYGQLGFCVESIHKIDFFRKSYSDANALLCGPWSTVIK